MNVKLLIVVAWAAVLLEPGLTRAEERVIRLGMIGLDTSHVTHFAGYLNDAKNNTGCRVVAAFPGGSPDFPPSATRVKNFTEQIRNKGIEIVDSIPALCAKVDGVLLESVDGRPHLEQVRPVLAARKPVFIDKPMAASLGDVIEILRLAKEAGVPCWSSSDCRFLPDVQKVKQGEVGDIIGCVAHGRCRYEPPLPDLYWYGVHTAETLFTLMGPGCVSVSRTARPDVDVIVGTWADGRVGIFRGSRSGKDDGGFLAFGSKGNFKGTWGGGYDGLLAEIVRFFKTGKAPVSPEETIGIFAFMTAADESKARGGAPVSLQSVIEAATTQPAAPADTSKHLRVVIFGAHCDDPECGTGGLVVMLTRAGHEVVLAYTTTHRVNRKVDGQPEDPVRRAESSAACAILGAKPKFFPYPHEALFADPATVQVVGDWLKEVKPDIVLTHWPLDTHPNHHVTGSLVWQVYDHGGRIWGSTDPARRPAIQGDWNLYFYESGVFTDSYDLETLAFPPTHYLDIGNVLDIKKRAVDCFKSQAMYNLWEVLDNTHRRRGAECGVQYAEAYFLVEAKPGRPLLPVSFLPCR